MRLLIDVDGVIANQVPPVLKEINKQFGYSFRKSDIKRWDQPLNHTDIKTEIESRVAQPAFVLRMPLIPGARQAVRSLARFHTITIATNRDHAVDEATQEWLRKKGIPFEGYINTKVEGKGALVGDLLIDDYPGNLVLFSAEANQRASILYSQPWNADFETAETSPDSPIFRAHGWKDVLLLVSLIRLGLELGRGLRGVVESVRAAKAAQSERVHS